MSNVAVLALVAPAKLVEYFTFTFAETVSPVAWNAPPLNSTAPLRAARLAEFPDAITPPLIIVLPVYEFEPPSVSVPAPIFVSDNVPTPFVMLPENEPPPTVKVAAIALLSSTVPLPLSVSTV
jgi:hypothetical protein